MRQRGNHGIALAVAASVLVGGVVAVPATAVAEERECPSVKRVDAGDVTSSKRWAYDLLDATRVWPVTQGEGIKVAVIDSGVEAGLDLFGGRVKEGVAYIHDKEANEKPAKGDRATTDCDGHGTEVAAIIAGEEDEESGFYGLAPKAEIYPYRIANARPGDKSQATKEDAEDGQEEAVVTEVEFAKAIDDAVADEVDVINLSVKYPRDLEPIREAIERAVAADIVIVAAAGNNGDKEKPSDTYPANYPGVIGVGAIDKHESRLPTSQVGPWVDLVAPGADVAAPLPDGKYQTDFGGTSGATAFVSGTAALLRAQHPKWKADKVAEQMMATAAPTAGGTGMEGLTDVEGEPGASQAYGHGRVDPYLAVTQTMEPGTDKNMDMNAPDANPAMKQREADFAKMQDWALWVGLGSLAVFIAALAGVGALRRGKKSKWNVQRVDKRAHLEQFDDGDPIPIFQGIKGLKE